MSLQTDRLGWKSIAGLGVAIVIAGQFSGWNFGLAFGWSNMFVATFAVAILYIGLALCVAELSSTLPGAGGLQIYCETAFGQMVGALVGFSVFLALALGTGVASNFVASYVHSVSGLGGWPVKLTLFTLIVAIHLYGVGEALWITLAVGAIATLSLLLFGASMLPSFNVAHLLPAGSPGLSAAGVFSCIPFAVWLFLGVEQAATASEETRDPHVAMPKGLMSAIAVLFVTSNTVLLLGPGGAGVSVVAGASDPLYAAMAQAPHVYGKALMMKIVGIGAITGLAATFFSLLFSASRQLYSIARAGFLPVFLSATNRHGAPYVAVLAIAAIGIPVSILPADIVLVGVVLMLSLTYVTTLAAFIVLRRRLHERPVAFRVPCGIPVAATVLVLAVLVLVASAVQSSRILPTLAAVMGLCGLAMAWRVRRQRHALLRSPS
ncbi:ethanolamine permease [Novosphingobium sp. 1529]|uniref:amino acid permease n=1 Tax=Novosphingobium sp. 1529 TaxID=3156424 RepID=UPI00145B06D2